MAAQIKRSGPDMIKYFRGKKKMKIFKLNRNSAPNLVLGFSGKKKKYEENLRNAATSTSRLIWNDPIANLLLHTFKQCA